jgi:imidazolonepropionase-like amidohydrolase
MYEEVFERQGTAVRGNKDRLQKYIARRQCAKDDSVGNRRPLNGWLVGVLALKTKICATSAPRETPLRALNFGARTAFVCDHRNIQKHTSITAEMNALVGYGSSDEEDEENVLPQRPAKVCAC